MISICPRFKESLSSCNAPWSVSPASIALFRLGLAFVVVADLILRSSDILMLYSDEGLLPRGVLLSADNGFSIYHCSGSVVGAGILMLMAAVVALCFGAGVWAPWSGVVSFLMLVSLHNRNPMVLNSGDSLLVSLHFFSLFLPSGNLFKKQLPVCRELHHYTAVLGVVVQMSAMYFFSAFWKFGEGWLDSGQAIFYAIHQDTIAWGGAAYLKLVPVGLLQIVTFSILIFEYFFALAVWLPWRKGHLRVVLIILAVIFHLVLLQATFRLGIFSWVAACGWLIFLPASVLGKDFFNESPSTTGGVSLGRSICAALCSFCLYLLMFLSVFGMGQRVFAAKQGVGIESVGEVADLALLDWLGLNQDWILFAPDAPIEDDSFQLILTYHDGRHVDYLSGQEVYADSLENVPRMNALSYPSARWRRFLSSLAQQLEGSPVPQAVAGSFIRRSQGDEVSVAAVSLFAVRESRPGAEPDYRQIWVHNAHTISVW